MLFFVEYKKDAKFFVEYKKDAKYLWNDRNNECGSKVSCRTRVKEKEHVVFQGQPLGKCWFCKCPKDMAKWLNESNWDNYSANNVGRFGSTVHANVGVSILHLKNMMDGKQMIVQEYHAISSTNEFGIIFTRMKINFDEKSLHAFS